MAHALHVANTVRIVCDRLQHRDKVVAIERIPTSFNVQNEKLTVVLGLHLVSDLAMVDILAAINNFSR